MPPLTGLRGFALMALLGAVALQQAQQAKPDPDVQNARYGPHERNVLDLWKAKAEKPTPLVVYVHGGGFMKGDKAEVPAPLLRKCLDAGISVASVNYRFSQQSPFPAPFLDSARAIQFLRSRASEWNIDPTRIAASGGSAGAGITLWIGFHDDLADPASDDPIARQSTRLTAMGEVGAQASYDPRFIKALIGGRAHEHVAIAQLYGLEPGEFDAPRAYKMYEEAAPINYVSAGDPPIFLYYDEPKGPLPADAKAGQGIHHPKFGEALKEKLDPLKIECVLKHRDDYAGQDDARSAMYGDMVEFFKKQFASQTARPKN